MTTEQLVAIYSPTVDIVSVIISAVLLFVIAWVLYFSKDNKFLYLKKSVHLIMIGSGVNIAFYFVTQNYRDAVVLVYVLRDLYHICFFFCLFFFKLYMKKMLSVRGRYVTVVTYFTNFFLAICIVMDLFSPLTKFGFCYVNGSWQDPLVNPYTIYYLYSVILLFVMLAFYSKRLIRSVRKCLIVTELVVVLIMVYQGIMNVNTYSGFTYVLPVLVVMILLHSKPFDDKTGALSSSSFESFLHQTVREKISVDYMVLQLDLNLMHTLPDELGKVLNSFWHTAFHNAILFNVEHGLFVLAIPRKSKNGPTEEKIISLIEAQFLSHYKQFQIDYKVIGLFDIDFVETDSDFRGILKYLLTEMEQNSIQIVDSKKREELRLMKVIRENLIDIEKQNDLNNPRVLVYCQPIRNMQTGAYDTAEALMRLDIPGHGIVMPGMFITLAEQYGHIHTLTRIMLNKVCRQIKMLEDEGYYFKRISVNFAASEIMADDFCSEILGILAANGISPSKIGIELTETQTESDFQIVKDRIGVLRTSGMTVCLDDVGTGYSNLDRIVKYDVDVVKFDRFFILEAEKDQKIGKMMKHLSEAFRDMNYELLYEGVETDENEELCMDCGADYIQGFKYSRPVPMEQMRDFFGKK